MIYLKSMTWMGFIRMGITTPTMDILALEFNFQAVQVNHGLEKYQIVVRVSMEKS